MARRRHRPWQRVRVAKKKGKKRKTREWQWEKVEEKRGKLSEENWLLGSGRSMHSRFHDA